MVSIVLAALALASVIVLAIRGARERRVLTAEVRALRDELRQGREGAAGTHTPESARGRTASAWPDREPEQQRVARRDPFANAPDDAGEPSRGPRTLH